MYGSGSKKLLVLCILRILQDYTDSEHKLTQQQIIDLLDKNYGLVCDRKSVKANIVSLIEFGYEIENDQGWYLVERDFENTELRMIIDSILFSKSIPTAQARILIEKVKGLGNEYFESKVKHVCNLPELQHTDNKQVLINVDVIDEAIEANCQISFIYNTYGADKKLHPRREEAFIINPYQIVANNGKYYLIGNYDKYDNISHYRIDRMTDVILLDSKRKPQSKVQGLEKGLNLPKHMAEHIYMFSDTPVIAEIKAPNYIMGEMVDWFGKDFTVVKKLKDEVVIRLKCSEKALFYIAMQYGEHIEVLKPSSLREQLLNAAKKMVEQYSD